MNSSPDELAQLFIASLSRRIVEKYDDKKTHSSKKLLERSVQKISDSNLKYNLEQNSNYFEKLLDLTVTHHLNEEKEKTGDGLSKNKNYLSLLTPQIRFTDALTLSKSTSIVSADDVVRSVICSRNLSPQQLASTLIQVQEWPLAASSQIVKLIYTQVALRTQEWSESSDVRMSISFLLSFAVVNSCRSHASIVLNPCWDAVTTFFQNMSCFIFIGHISYWMKAFSQKKIPFDVEKSSFLYKRIVNLLTTARKCDEHMISDKNDPSLPISCLFTHAWLSNISDTTERRLILRDIYTFMRQYEYGKKLSDLWSLLVRTLRLDDCIDRELIESGVRFSSGRFSKFCEWFIESDTLVNKAKHCIEMSVASDGKYLKTGNSGLETVVDGKSVFMTEAIKEVDESSESEIDEEDDCATDDDIPVTFYLDKRGSSLLNEDVSADSSQILTDLGDVGKKSMKNKKDKKRKSMTDSEVSSGIATELDDEQMEKPTRKGSKTKDKVITEQAAE